MRIGVSGASGQLGRSVLEELKARGRNHSIVGISRTPANMQARVQGRHGDSDQPGTLLEAYRWLDCLLLIPSADLRPGLRGRQFVAAIDAAVKADVGHIVLMSLAGTCEVREASMYAAYWTGEQHLFKTAPKWTILRMNFYAESVVQLDQMSLATGVITGLGEERVA
jgi:NAD(P)H dehydrogenase (quinone)